MPSSAGNAFAEENAQTSRAGSAAQGSDQPFGLAMVSSDSVRAASDRQEADFIATRAL